MVIHQIIEYFAQNCKCQLHGGAKEKSNGKSGILTVGTLNV